MEHGSPHSTLERIPGPTEAEQGHARSLSRKQQAVHVVCTWLLRPLETPRHAPPKSRWLNTHLPGPVWPLRNLIPTVCDTVQLQHMSWEPLVANIS